MIGPEDAPYTYEYKDYYKIIPSVHPWTKSFKIRNGKKVKPNFIYDSLNNSEWMSIPSFRRWMKNNSKFIGVI